MGCTRFLVVGLTPRERKDMPQRGADKTTVVQASAPVVSAVFLRAERHYATHLLDEGRLQKVKAVLVCVVLFARRRGSCRGRRRVFGSLRYCARAPIRKRNFLKRKVCGIALRGLASTPFGAEGSV